MSLDRDTDSIGTDVVTTPPASPTADSDSRAVLDDAIAALTDRQFPPSPGDAAAELPALASLLADITSHITAAIRGGHDQDHTRDDIATWLGTGTSTARRMALHRRSEAAMTPTGPRSGRTAAAVGLSHGDGRSRRPAHRSRGARRAARRVRHPRLPRRDPAR